MRRKHSLGTAAVGGSATAALLILAASTAAPAQAIAAPTTHTLTINAAPNPVTAGDPVVVFGRLSGPSPSQRKVSLFHRLPGARGFSFVQSTTTDPTGAYEFARADGVVTTNRSWYVRSMGARSRAVVEHVMAQVTLHGPADPNLTTGTPYSFTGTVTPGPLGARLLLQRQDATGPGEHWATVDHGVVGPGGAFTIVHRFIVPGDANVRVLLTPDRLNVASPSSPLTFQISQAQNPLLTIAAAPNPISEGGTVTISGTVQGAANKPVTLWAHPYRQPFAPVAQGTTDGSGHYSFTQTPVYNAFYEVRGAGRVSAQLFEGVKAVLTAQASPTTAQAGQPVTFSGTVAPDKTGHAIYLEEQSASGRDYHALAVAQVGPGSSYAIGQRLYQTGAHNFRILLPGGPDNQGAASPPITVTVTPAPASALAPPPGQ